MNASIWKEILELDKVGVDDNFFEVGDTTLDVIQMTTRLQETLYRDIPMVHIFQYPTISALSGYFDKEEVSGFAGDNLSKAVARGKKDRMR
jgi:hypothetical protein